MVNHEQVLPGLELSSTYKDLESRPQKLHEEGDICSLKNVLNQVFARLSKDLLFKKNCLAVPQNIARLPCLFVPKPDHFGQSCRIFSHCF